MLGCMLPQLGILHLGKGKKGQEMTFLKSHLNIFKKSTVTFLKKRNLLAIFYQVI